MRIINIKGLTIQFDDFDQGADKHNALNMIDTINETLQQKFPDSCPQIMIASVSEDNISIDSKVSDERGTLIDRIMSHIYKDDDPKRDGSNRAYLEGLSDDELESKWDEWENSQV